ncbi:MAG TPA: hypothetical protein VFD43_06900 [Planctomycetota bacterium]|nr:hypothetical protein [Planctomycetota bacterium]
MRTSAATVVGLIAGGALGFLLRGWFVDEPAGEAPGATRGETAGAAAPALPAPPPARAEPLQAAPAPLAATPLSLEPGSGAAADALVGILVYGAVLEADGRPASLGQARWISFDQGSGEPRRLEVPTSATYAISGLKPGPCTVRTDFLGYRPTRHELKLDAAHPAVRLDLVLQPAVVLMVKAFTPSGEPLSDALHAAMGPAGMHSWPLAAIATREPPPALLPEISHRNYDQWEIGRFTGGIDLLFQDAALPQDVLGKLELDESLPAYVSLVFRHIVLQTQTVEPGATEVVFTVPLESVTRLLGGVRVRVVSAETRQPIPGAHAELSDSQSGGGHATPDADGVFIWERQRPGLLELQVMAPDHEYWAGEVSIPPGGEANLGTLELTPAVSASGVVLDPAGEPVSVRLRALPDEDRGLGMGGRRYEQSGADGRFTCAQLGQRRYLLSVSDQEWTGLPVPVDLRQGSVEGVVITVAAGTLVRLHSRWPEGERYDVQVITQEGLPIRTIEDWLGDRPWSKRLIPADYVAVLLREGRELKRLPFSVGAEELAIDLAP